MQRIYVIDHSTRIEYTSLFILKDLCDKPKGISFHALKNNSCLKTMVQWLLERSYICVSETGSYVMSEKGFVILSYLLKKYESFLQCYDIFSGVDIRNLDFAFRYYHTFKNEDDWERFSCEERWLDLRGAVAEYYKFDIVELIFWNFVTGGEFSCGEKNRPFKLVFESIWNRIQTICNQSIPLDSLSHTKGGKKIPAEDVIQTILKKGKQILSQTGACTL